MATFSAIGIKKLWYADVLAAALTPSTLKAMVGTSGTATEITNVHQDTWSISEDEPSQDTYKNQLNGKTYRRGTKTMGDVKFNFSIGAYDFVTKAALMGGNALTSVGASTTTASTAVGWERSFDAVNIRKCLIALTEDDIYCVLSEADLMANESYTDGAVAIGVVGTGLEPSKSTSAAKIASEYWYTKDTVDKAT